MITGWCRRSVVVAVTSGLVASGAVTAATGPQAGAATVGSVRIVTSPGTDTPPERLGASSMTTIGQDPRTGTVRSVDTPVGAISFNKDVEIYQVPDDWATWSHGYTGSVYVPSNGSEKLKLNMPPKTRAFYFYVEPNDFDLLDVTVTLTDSKAAVTKPVDGEGGAQYFGIYATGTATIRQIQVESQDTTFAVGEFGIAAPAFSSYVALGDSYSSGEGAGADGKYDAGKCHRSTNAWPNKLSRLSDRLHLITNVACSGATTDALMNSFKGQDPQLMELESIRSARTITVTMGGNDINFAGLIKDCVVFDPCDDELDAARERLTKPGGLKDQLRTAYEWIHSSAPYAHLVVVGYPRITPATTAEKRKCGWLEDKELKAAAKLTVRLDEVIRSAAESRGDTYVSVLNALEGHEECSKDPWMYPIGHGGGSQQGHPTNKGQAAVAEVVARSLR